MARVKSVSFPDDKNYLIEYVESTGRNFSSVIVEALEMYLQLEKSDHDFTSMKIQRLQTQIESVNNQIKSLEISREMLNEQVANAQDKHEKIKADRTKKQDRDAEIEVLVQKEMQIVYDEYHGVLPYEDCRPYALKRVQERVKVGKM